jgi:preprotein translocase subunit SecG
MQAALLVLQCFLSVALVVVILLQRTAQDGGGLMGGGNTMGGLFTARGTANLLTRFTKWLAVLFIANSLGLGFIASHQHQNHSLLDQIAPVVPVSAPAVPNAAAPASTPAPAAAPVKTAPAKTPAAPKEHSEPEVPMAH